MVLKVRAQAFPSRANVRHEHEWKVWQDVRLPDGKILIPGVIAHATNLVEHPGTGGGPPGAIRQPGRAGERDCGDRLRAGWPPPSRDCLGQIPGHGRGRAAGD